MKKSSRKALTALVLFALAILLFVFAIVVHFHSGVVSIVAVLCLVASVKYVQDAGRQERTRRREEEEQMKDW